MIRSAKLSRRLRPYFSAQTLSRGKEYFNDNLVDQIVVSNQVAFAKVHGTQVYSVALDWSSKYFRPIKAACTCAHFEDGSFCKHLWAFILAIELHPALPSDLGDYNLHLKAIELKQLQTALKVYQNQQVQPTQHAVATQLKQPSMHNKLAHGLTPNWSTNHNLVQTPQSGTWRQIFLGGPRSRKKGDQDNSTRNPLADFFFVLSDTAYGSAARIQFFASQVDHEGCEGLPVPVSVNHQGYVKTHDENYKNLVKTIALLASGEEVANNSYYYHRQLSKTSSRELSLATFRMLTPNLFLNHLVLAHEEDYLRFKQGEEALALRPIQFDQLYLEVVEGDSQTHLLKGFIGVSAVEAKEIKSTLSHSKIPVEQLHVFLSPNFFRFEQWVGFVDLPTEQERWFKELFNGPLFIPAEDEEAFLEAMLNQDLPIELPERLRWPEVRLQPLPSLELRQDRASGRYLVDLKFEYGSRRISFINQAAVLPSAENCQVFIRDLRFEESVFSSLSANYFTSQTIEGYPTLQAKWMSEFIRETLGKGLPVQVDQKRISEAQNFKLSVSSGLDWFDVDGEVEFSGRWIKYPAILEAIRRGETFVPLDDGSVGLMDEKLTQRIEQLSTFAERGEQGLRFSSSQGLLLNALLEKEPQVKFDQKFKELRNKIKRFSGIKPSSPARSFKGELRPYQRQGLGWLRFLEEFGIGGILADDMGLGKTVQCLAFLDRQSGRRPSSDLPLAEGDHSRSIHSDSSTLKPTITERETSLLIAPKSLLENWQLEAKKFTPGLKVLIHSGSNRDQSGQVFKHYDLIVTTYQTMLKDIEVLHQIEWGTVVADEAQMIKNPAALVSKAIKSLRARFRLAMTGTPIENSIEDLYSISDFVNPGFLTGRRKTKKFQLDEHSRAAMARAFKPIILRRTKDQVLKDLPAKTEQIISVNLEPKQLKIYNELKRYYQSQLLKEVHEKGIEKSQIQILAALTRLRQAALHPGLIEPKLKKMKSSKFEVVLSMLDEILAENQKVLIFSQFTSLLGLLKAELKCRKINFCYLDGQTKKRQQIVDDFKASDQSVFLISLKAGGVGLNLVEANYVFLLDPWWNPAVESQAIDRVHRIGQQRAVNAYRFIAKNTVEEKILELQKSKRDLVNDIIGQTVSPLRSLSTQDLEDLFN